MDKIVIIDGLSLVFKEFHALIELKNSKGYGTGAAYGTVKQFLYLFTKYRWDSNGVIFVWDKKPHWKYELFPTYKAKRKKLDLPEKMAVPVQLKLTEKILKYMGIAQAWSEGMESDDTCITLAKHFNNKGKRVLIISKDHDLYQGLVEGQTEILIHEDQGEQVFTEADFIKKYGIVPGDYDKAQTLGGCGTDKVPGMPGVSIDTAIEIVKANRWEKIINNDPDLIFPSKRAEGAFRKNFPAWNQSVCYKLVHLNNNVKVKYELNKFDEEKLKTIFYFLEFKSFLQQDNFLRIKEIFS